MSIFCSHPTCQAQKDASTTPLDIAYFRFPSDQSQKLEWRRNCNMENFPEVFNPWICERHFHPDDLMHTKLPAYLSGMKEQSKTIAFLREGAIPCSSAEMTPHAGPIDRRGPYVFKGTASNGKSVKIMIEIEAEPKAEPMPTTEMASFSQIRDVEAMASASTQGAVNHLLNQELTQESQPLDQLQGPTSAVFANTRRFSKARREKLLKEFLANPAAYKASAEGKDKATLACMYRWLFFENGFKPGPIGFKRQALQELLAREETINEFCLVVDMWPLQRLLDYDFEDDLVYGFKNIGCHLPEIADSVVVVLLQSINENARWIFGYWIGTPTRHEWFLLLLNAMKTAAQDSVWIKAIAGPCNTELSCAYEKLREGNTNGATMMTEKPIFLFMDWRGTINAIKNRLLVEDLWLQGTRITWNTIRGVYQRGGDEAIAYKYVFPGEEFKDSDEHFNWFVFEASQQLQANEVPKEEDDQMKVLCDLLSHLRRLYEFCTHDVFYQSPVRHRTTGVEDVNDLLNFANIMVGLLRKLKNQAGATWIELGLLERNIVALHNFWIEKKVNSINYIKITHISTQSAALLRQTIVPTPLSAHATISALKRAAIFELGGEDLFPSDLLDESSDNTLELTFTSAPAETDNNLIEWLAALDRNFLGASGYSTAATTQENRMSANATLAAYFARCIDTQLAQTRCKDCLTLMHDDQAQKNFALALPGAIVRLMADMRRKYLHEPRVVAELAKRVNHQMLLEGICTKHRSPAKKFIVWVVMRLLLAVVNRETLRGFVVRRNANIQMPPFSYKEPTGAKKSP